MRDNQKGIPEDIDYALGRSYAEYDHLIEQGELFRPLTERMLRSSGIRRGMRVLDVGCGVGDVSFLVAAIVGPEGRVVGADLDAEALKVAEKRRREQRIDNVEFLHSDARLINPVRPFDAAVGRFTLMFITEPTEALEHIAKHVRLGGIVAFHEFDARVTTAVAMNQPILARLQELLARTFERSGAHLEIGSELYWRMLSLGLEPEPRPLAEFAVHMGKGEVAYRRWALFARSMLPKIVEYGLATSKNFSR